MSLLAVSNAASRLYESAQTALGIVPEHAQSINKELRIERLFVHPIKSCRGTSVQEAHFDEGGLRYDRSWLIIDAKTHKFQTARDLPKMVTISPSMDVAANLLRIEVPNAEEGQGSATIVETPLEPARADVEQMELIKDIELWGTQVDGYAVSSEADAALTTFFGKEVRLVRKGPARRNAGLDDPRGDESAMHFQDFYPLLVATSASLQHVRETLLASVHSSSLLEQPRPRHTNSEQADASSAATPDSQGASGEKVPPGGWDVSSQGSTDAQKETVTAYKVPNGVRREYWTPEVLARFEIERFRPNILVGDASAPGSIEKEAGEQGHWQESQGLIPWEEDSWTHIEVFSPTEAKKGLGFGSQVEGKGIGIECCIRCARCLVPSVDPKTGVRDPHIPYLVLQKFRQVQPEMAKIGKPCFGMLSSPCQAQGTLKVGDTIRVTRTTDPAKRTITMTKKK